MRVNVGCGAAPTPGWVNFDNSPVARVAKFGFLVRGLRAVGVLNDAQVQFADTIQSAGIVWANVTKRLPVPGGAASVVYSSHMLEHLDRSEAVQCLAEFMRVLAPGGTLRLALPDLERLARAYLDSGDADQLVEATYLAQTRQRRLRDRVRFMLVGHREHMWMYDSKSLMKLVASCGFVDVRQTSPGETTIPDPGALNLREREEESIYVEARKPT